MILGKRLRVAKLTPELALSTSSTVARSRFAFLAATMTSAVAERLMALRKLLSSLVLCPAPGPPMWKTLAAKCARVGCTRARASGEPPTMSVRLPFSAAAAPPEMPASRYSTPDSARRAWICCVELGAAVLRSTTTMPARSEAMKAGSPSTTFSTTLLSGNDRNTMSLDATTAEADSANWAPAFATASACMSKPSTGTPLSTTRRVIRPPMLPSPTNLIRSFMSFTPLLRGTDGRGDARKRAILDESEAVERVRVMAAHEMRDPGGHQLADAVEAGVHLRQVGDEGEWQVLLVLLVVVHRVGCEQHVPIRCRDSHDGLPRGVPTDLHDLDALGEREGTLERAHAALLVGRAEGVDLLLLRRPAELGPLAHLAHPEIELRLRDHDLGIREKVEIADVVVVRMRDHERDGRGRVDAECLVDRGKVLDEGAVAVGAARRRETRIDEDRPLSVPDDPDEVVHVDGSVGLPVDLVIEEHLGAVPPTGAVLDDDELVQWAAALRRRRHASTAAVGQVCRRSCMSSRSERGLRPVNCSTTSVTFAMFPERTSWPKVTMPSLHHGTGDWEKSPVASRGTPSASHMAYICSSVRSTISMDAPLSSAIISPTSRYERRSGPVTS